MSLVGKCPKIVCSLCSIFNHALFFLQLFFLSDFSVCFLFTIALKWFSVSSIISRSVSLDLFSPCSIAAQSCIYIGVGCFSYFICCVCWHGSLFSFFFLSLLNSCTVTAVFARSQVSRLWTQLGTCCGVVHALIGVGCFAIIYCRFGCSPELSESGFLSGAFSYVPSHLNYMLLELFKNASRVRRPPSPPTLSFSI
jgi:hypothetical protein